MICFYFDEDALEQSLIKSLRARGIDVLTARDAGMIEQEDGKHLAYATKQGRVLFSFNVGDYYALHTDYLTAGHSHAGIVVARQQTYSTGELMRRLSQIVAVRSAAGMRNQIEFLSAWGQQSGVYN